MIDSGCTLPAIPDDQPTRAVWWCAVNGGVSPPGYCLSDAEQQALYDVLIRVPGVETAGLALWRARYDAGLYPQSGEPREQVV